MRIFLLIAAVTLSLCLSSGCQKAPEPYGNFANAESGDLVKDVLAVMLVAYPPAKTHLRLIQETGDAFGLRLVENLRENGYAVAEHAAVMDPASALAFAYVLDLLKDGGELRLTLHVGKETLSRLYTIQGEDGEALYVPVSAWGHRQEGEAHGGQ